MKNYVGTHASSNILRQLVSSCRNANPDFSVLELNAGDAVDIQQACVEEAALLAGPVCGLKARLEQLLVEWPEHPVLVQLSAICDRLTGMLAKFFL